MHNTLLVYPDLPGPSPSEPPSSAPNVTTPDVMFRGTLTLSDWKYHPDLANSNSSLYKAYEEIICREVSLIIILGCF